MKLMAMTLNADVDQLIAKLIAEVSNQRNKDFCYLLFILTFGYIYFIVVQKFHGANKLFLSVRRFLLAELWNVLNVLDGSCCTIFSRTLLDEPAYQATERRSFYPITIRRKEFCTTHH